MPKTTVSKAKPKKRALRRDFEKVYPGDHVIKIITAVNPKRPGTKSHNMFEKYYDAKTVADALSMGVTYRQLDYDVQHKFIEVRWS